jgi:hypothetical protein
MTSARSGDFKLLIHEAEMDNLAGWVLEHPDDETGGDLFGFWTHSGAPTVQLVLGPAATARHAVTSFHQDREYLEESGRYVQACHGLQHIGDWHSHHGLGLRTPSSGDANTARRVFEYTEFRRFMLLIATIERGPSTERPSLRQRVTRAARNEMVVRVGAYLFERDVPHYRTGQWVILPGTSPVGESVRSASAAERPHRPCSTWWVPQTTLDSTAGLPRAPAAGWYTSSWGSALLRNLDERCRATFEQCRMSLDPSAGELTYSFSAAGTEVAVGFPSNYPARPAVALMGDRRATRRLELPVDKADALFERLAAALQSGHHDVRRETPEKEDTDGVEPEPDGSTGTGAGHPDALLPESPLEPSGRADEDVP